MSEPVSTRLTFASLTAVVITAFTLAATTVSASPASISGKWHGSGVVKLKEGGQETVRCRVTYGRIAGQDFSLNARCASGAGRLNQSGKLTRVATNKYVGNVTSNEYSVSARVAITVNGGFQHVTISSDQGSANLRLARR
ncbi:MAG: hypothetical protein ACR2O4_08885 [Hyphomicrobiaceae bacterium]